ncbi:hypothetical protein KP509_29G060300 [Ceratopteris richardii]|uniref:BZIP domain-containing protein n=1 Tax=Ceratopteris richardii TaxID=49495 RepID=A0A8T2R9S0_CERRI|nr:hypothetical protein KP509_29G060300 [Ceratopteris richardii]
MFSQQASPSGYEARPKMEIIKAKAKPGSAADGADIIDSNCPAGQFSSREMECQVSDNHDKVLQKRNFDGAFSGTSNGDEASKLVPEPKHGDGDTSTAIGAPSGSSFSTGVGLLKPGASYTMDYWNGQGAPLMNAADAPPQHPVPGSYMHATGSMMLRHGPSSDGGSTDYWIQDEKELKRQKRKEANRESARRSRMRKQAECDELTEKVQALTAENDSLRLEVERLSELCQKLSAENHALLEQLKQQNA